MPQTYKHAVGRDLSRLQFCLYCAHIYVSCAQRINQIPELLCEQHTLGLLILFIAHNNVHELPNKVKSGAG